MSDLGAIFVRLVGQAANYTRLYCVKCDGDQAHERLDVPAQVTSVARTGEYWRCARCGNILIWSATP